MTQENITTFTCEYKGFYSESTDKISDGKRIVKFRSRTKAKEVSCPYCQGKVIGHGKCTVKLVDVPYYPGCPTIYEIDQHRYLCKECKSSFLEKNPFQVQSYRLTKRCIEWVFKLLSFQLPTSTIAEFLGIHWNTVRKLEHIRIKYELNQHEEEIRRSSYRPYYLAVDEFAIRKGHRYATCVMDLVKGDVLWVGKGRAIKDFTLFFESFKNADYLSQVKAIAMDMNASYSTVVKAYLPNAEIIYDRYHVQAQFGHDVMGQVRLDAARMHKALADEKAHNGTFSKEEIMMERKQYRTIKKARWLCLQSSKSLSPEKEQSLNEILSTHSDLAVCYAMKEELSSLFDIRDPVLARSKWNQWFDAAINSGIQPLVRFGKQKLKRLDGLVAHASIPINTGKLEGFNNKIKVAKRNAYGFRNFNFFFDFIRFISMSKSLKNTCF